MYETYRMVGYIVIQLNNRTVLFGYGFGSMQTTHRTSALFDLGLK